MEIKPTPIAGLVEIFSPPFQDERGWFMEIYKQGAYSKICPNIKFVQDNLSFSRKGVIRGLHLQLSPFQQAKLVMVIKGSVLDVVVDLRKGSATFGQSYSCQLDDKRHNMLLVPEGFAHGFSALEDSWFYYKCSSEYNPNHETGICWNDPILNIDWKSASPVLSAKDQHLPTLEELLIKSVISPQ